MLVKLSQKVKKKIKTNPEVDTATWLSNLAFAWCVQGPDVSQPPGSRNNQASQQLGILFLLGVV